MTRVCLVGEEDVTLQYELLSRETAREALSTYDLHEPFANAVGVETVSLGAAVALLNDLEWYLVRFVSEAMVLEPSVSENEWLSRALAMAVRDDELAPEETGRFLKIYGLESAEAGGNEAVDGGTAPVDGESGDDGEGSDEGVRGAGVRRLVEPMYVTRTGEDLPDYDLREVDGTLVERVTESEFGA
ncbi:hypothetical protein BRC60_06495 [Halobacteriales archaeon QH_1_68_42]|nr:MAG: hypothetical protein BRC60_06495 [Halobacteriales archaeon QH_1_68_42]